jgi:nucleolar pre-ribosomal-associated protein 1
MSVNVFQRGTQHTAKRVKLDDSDSPNSLKFMNADEVQKCCKIKDQHQLTEGMCRFNYRTIRWIYESWPALNALRNQLTIKYNEPSISPQDDRLLLAQRWLELVPDGHDIFELWENATEVRIIIHFFYDFFLIFLSAQRQSSLVAALVSVLSALLTLLSSHYTYHSLGQPILKTLLTPPWMRLLNSYLGGSHNETILATLKLFNSMSAFASGKERKTVMELFAWETKVCLYHGDDLSPFHFLFF